MIRNFVRPGRSFIAKMEEGEHPHAAIEELLISQNIESAWITGIGGFAWARLGVFNYIEKTYNIIDIEPLDKHVLEVISLNGNSVIGEDGKFYTHLHVNIARRQHETYSGHLVDARVRPFLEVYVIELIGDTKSIQKMFSHRWS